jgi:hypothetical protein
VLFFMIVLRHNHLCPMRTTGTPGGLLIVHAVMDRPIGKGSVVEVLLFDPWRGARSDIQAEYDLASLGEVESIHGPFCNPPRWMVSYKGEVSAEKGDRIQPKEQKGNRMGLAIHQTGLAKI